MADRPKIDTKGLTWIQFKKWAKDSIQELREENDDPRPESETTDIRARIAVFKEILALEDHAQPLNEDGSTSYL